MEDADAFLNMILKAVRDVGVILFVKDIPHDWLFPRCRAVVHHGGAGTTAIGLRCGVPTIIAPLFGDQAFWGPRVAAARAGAHQCIRYNNLSADELAESIRQCLTREARDNAQRIAKDIANEGNGAANAIRHFHDGITLEGPQSWRCDLFKDRIAVWAYQRSGKLHLSAVAAAAMVQAGRIRPRDLSPLRLREWNEIYRRNDPFTGGFSAILAFCNRLFRELARGPLSLKHLYGPSENFVKQNDFDLEAQSNGALRAVLTTADNFIGAGTPQVPTLHPSEHQFRPICTEITSVIELCSTHGEDWDRGASESSHANLRPTVQEPYTGNMVLLEFASSVLCALILILEFPAVFLANIADGFYNLPQVYGDPTVRPPLRITSFGDGLRSGMREVMFGPFDAVVGLIALPIRDAQIYGALGLCTGSLKSIGGLICKPCAAIFGLPGYTLKGLWCTLRKTSVSSNIKVQRLTLGRFELANFTALEQHYVSEAGSRLRWRWYPASWTLRPYQDPKKHWRDRY